MSISFSLVFAELAHRPLFGNQWLALLAVLAGVAVFMVAIVAMGRWLAATHPESPPKPTPTKAPAPIAAVPAGPPPEVLAITAACVSMTYGPRARITSVRPGGPSVEMLMQQWSLEGRRQIYSSHQVR